VKGQARFWVVAIALVALHFGLRPRLGDSRYMPDLLLVALLLYAIRSRPGPGAVAGLLVGLATDALAPSAFGAGALAHTVVGYMGGWLRTFVVEENVAVASLFILVAAWFRDAIQAIASAHVSGGGLLWQLFAVSPVAAAATGAAALIVLLLAGGILAPRRA
jgi:rod shape-determining protein MreD